MWNLKTNKQKPNPKIREQIGGYQKHGVGGVQKMDERAPIIK